MTQTYDNYYKEYYAKNKEIIKARRRKKYLDGGSIKERQWYKDNRDKVDSYSRTWKMWYAAKNRAKEENLPFNLEVADIIIPEYCPILGIKLDDDFSDKSKRTSPSLDKIVPELGYVKGNVAVISFKANRMKQDLTLEVINKITEYINKYSKVV